MERLFAIEITLSQNQAQALTAYLQRLKLAHIQPLAVNDLQAQWAWQGTRAFQRALSECGFLPRT